MLRRLGHTIDFPYAQTCCGQVHCNTGYQPEAIPLVRRFVKVFRDSEVVL
ncbi:MAG: heterodisulfide reductase-related iron-sulfur binding cluster [Acidobacteriaceae bacterium]